MKNLAIYKILLYRQWSDPIHTMHDSENEIGISVKSYFLKMMLIGTILWDISVCGLTQYISTVYIGCTMHHSEGVTHLSSVAVAAPLYKLLPVYFPFPRRRSRQQMNTHENSRRRTINIKMEENTIIMTVRS